MKIVRDFDFQGKRVILRVDYNVPLDEKGEVADDFRIKKTIPTIEYLIKNGAKVILISHLGRPEKKEERKKLSLKVVAKNLEDLLGFKIKFVDDCLGEKAKEEVSRLKPEEVILLENLRFYEGEVKNDEGFAKSLSELGDIYLDDAFASCHRRHASIVSLPKFLPSGAGLLLEKEIKALSRITTKPARPLVAVIAGAKIASKIKVIKRLFQEADHLLLGGKIANYILETKKNFSLRIDSSDYELRQEIKSIEVTNPKLHLPVDGIISLADVSKGIEEGYIREGAPGTVRKEEAIYDIGPETIDMFSHIIESAQTIVWNGPLGYFESSKFEIGTKKIGEAIIRNYGAFKVAGGGETILALDKFGLLDKFDHISSGGTAMLEFLAQGSLPGIEALDS